MDCIFCKIIKGEIPSYKIYEDEHVFAMLDIAADVEGHTLVLPKKHVLDMNEADEQTFAQVMNATKRISAHYLSLGYDGINVLTNCKASAGQEVMHWHVHIFPRRNGDEAKIKVLHPDKQFNLEELTKKLRID